MNTVKNNNEVPSYSPSELKYYGKLYLNVAADMKKAGKKTEAADYKNRGQQLLKQARKIRRAERKKEKVDPRVAFCAAILAGCGLN